MNSYYLRSALILLASIATYFYLDNIQNGIRVMISTQPLACRVETAFAAVTEFESMKNLGSPNVLGYDFFLEEHKKHPPKSLYLGLRFSETRRMGQDDELVTNLVVTEFEPNTRVRLVADTHGTIWDTTFLFHKEAEKDQSQVHVKMHAKSHQLLPRLLNPILQVFFRAGLSKHMATMKEWCEGHDMH